MSKREEKGVQDMGYCMIQTTRYRISIHDKVQDSGYRNRVQGTALKMQGTRFRIQDAAYKIQNTQDRTRYKV